MSKKKKPEGEELKEFCRVWDASDKAGKTALANSYGGASYETARHWRSDASVPIKKLDNFKMEITREELLSLPVSTHMDFCFFDIEASNLNADFSVMLSAVLKPYNEEPVVFRADNYPEWFGQRNDDRGIVADIANELRRHAVIVTHYGSAGYYDTPFLKAKMLKYKLPPLPAMFSIDTYRISRANFKLSSRRLGSMTRYLGLGDKEEVEGQLWMNAAYGTGEEATAALDAIVAHNVQDVILLEKLTCLIFPYLKAIPRL